MEVFQSQKKFSCFSIWFLFRFSSLFLPSSSDTVYTLPDHYYINCGSSTNISVYRQTFTGDGSPGSHVLASRDSELIENLSLPADQQLYQTARIFRKRSSYEFELDQDGTYMVRLHFFPFRNLFDARFSVFASGFLLLSNFTVQNNKFPHIEEFLLKIHVGKFRIYFLPDTQQSFAFVNAIEVILTPSDFVPVSARRVTQDGESHDRVLNGPLHVIHRINVGGKNITPSNDTMLRYWIPDDDYLFFKNTARNSEVYAHRRNYQSGGATEFHAPDFVYGTAKEMNTDDGENALSNFNVSWRFGVRKGAEHLVRLHFCDIVSRTANESFRFNLYIYSHYSDVVYPYEVSPEPATPFYRDFVVRSDDSGFMNISIGPNSDSPVKTAFLNGVEIMELLTEITEAMSTIL